MTARRTGRVIASHGRRYLVEQGGEVIACITRGKKGGVACNDRVEFSLTGAGTGVIEAILPRRNLLYRADIQRTKLLAAHVDLVVAMTAAVPTPRNDLLNRCLVAAEAAGIEAMVLVNKLDLPETAAYLAGLSFYQSLGYPLLAISAPGGTTALQPLTDRLRGKTSILVGASGVGKSTLVNALHPEALAATDEISDALDAGRHTTTHTRLYHLPTGGEIIDSPGMQEFGLKHLNLAELQGAFAEMRRLVGHCRFHNCRHRHEPGCQVRAEVAAGHIARSRYQAYLAIMDEILENPGRRG